MKTLMTKMFCTDKSWGILLVRLFLAWIFIGSGLKKVFGLFGGPGLDGFTGFLDKIGIAPASFFAPLVGWSELICGALLLLGLLSRLASVVVVIIMAVAIVKVHPTDFNYPGIVLVSALAILNLGSGTFSIDRIIAKK